MSTPHPSLICKACPQRATCRKLYQPGATCEHWLVAEAPGLGTLAMRAGSEVLRWAIQGAPLASAEIQAQRQQICTACPHWKPEAYAGTGSCGHPSCHCTRAKLALATSYCPMGKWLAVHAAH